MSFCTVINCMDGRVQLPVINYLMTRFNVKWVDSITEPAPILALSQQNPPQIIDSIFRRLDISFKKHHSCAIAIVAHHGCAGNPVSKDIQLAQLDSAIEYIAQKYPNLPVIGLWVDENWAVNEIKSGG